MKTIVIDIKELVQVEKEPVKWVAGKDMGRVERLKDAFLEVEDGRIASFGRMSECPAVEEGTRVVEARGRLVLPTFCDPHTHLVYAGSREIEYADKIRGLSYEEIARRGGGILSTVKRVREATEEELFESAAERAREIAGQGTGAVEIKSGYGLDLETELKMLRVARRLKETSPLTIRTTFLGAHATPPEFKGRQGEYVDAVINEMIPVVAAEELADYIDVFCDSGFFTVEETDRLLNAGMKHGLRAKVHANELGRSGGVQVGVKYNALSVDHLERAGQEEIEALLGSETMPTVLPGATLFLDLPRAPVRAMIDSGLPVALASDYNPGSAPSGNMRLVMSLGCILYKMLPEEALNAATINAARAMGAEEEVGSIARGKRANFLITKPVPGLAYLPYSFGSDWIERVYIGGERVR